MTMEKDAIFQKFVVPAAKAAGKSVGKYLKTAWRGHGTNTAMKGAADDAITKYTNEGLKGAVRRGAVTSAITGTGTGGLSYMRARGQGYSPEEARAKALKAGVVGGALGGAVGGAWGKMRLPALRNRAALLGKMEGKTVKTRMYGGFGKDKYKDVYKGTPLKDVMSGQKGVRSKIHAAAGEAGLRGWTGAGKYTRYMPVGNKSFIGMSGAGLAREAVTKPKPGEKRKFEDTFSNAAGTAAWGLLPGMGIMGMLGADAAAKPVGRAIGRAFAHKPRPQASV